jgi:hypothetical protein
MSNDPEDDLRNARAERKRHARERERDQERLRDREQKRAEASASDREATREKERRRQDESESRQRTYEARYGTYADDRSTRPDLGRELERVVYALARSNTRLLVGVTEILGNLITNLNDSVWGRPMGGPRVGVDEPYDPYAEPVRSRRYEPEFDDEPLRSRRYEERGRYRTPNRVESFVTRSSGVLSNLSEDLTQAVRDSAAILSRSARDLSSILEDVAERDRYGYDEPEPAEEVAEEAVEEAEARARAEARAERRPEPPDA